MALNSNQKVIGLAAAIGVAVFVLNFSLLGGRGSSSLSLGSEQGNSQSAMLIQVVCVRLTCAVLNSNLTCWAVLGFWA